MYNILKINILNERQKNWYIKIEICSVLSPVKTRRSSFAANLIIYGQLSNISNFQLEMRKVTVPNQQLVYDKMAGHRRQISAWLPRVKLPRYWKDNLSANEGPWTSNYCNFETRFTIIAVIAYRRFVMAKLIVSCVQHPIYY